MDFVVCISWPQTGQLTRSFGAPYPASCPIITDFSMPNARQSLLTHFARRFTGAPDPGGRQVRGPFLHRVLDYGNSIADPIGDNLLYNRVTGERT